MLRTVYKAVRRYGERLGSIIWSAATDRMGLLTYPPGERVYPRVGKLMAFSSEGHALCFIHRHFPPLSNTCSPTYELELWEGEGEVCDDFDAELFGDSRGRFLLDTSFLRACGDEEELFSLLRSAWSVGNECYLHAFIPTPEGTIFCNHITLTKRIGGRDV